MKVFSTRPLIAVARERLMKEGIAYLEWTEKREPTPTELLEACKDVQGILSIGRQQFDSCFFEKTPKLKVLALHSVGFDQVDLVAATKYGVAVGNTPGVLSKATADTAFLLMQNVARKAFFHHRRILNDDWDFFEPLQDVGQDLEGKILGVFGLGRIGYQMALSARKAFNMKIIYHNRHHHTAAEEELGATRVSFEQLLENSDVLTVHANLTPETTGLFNKKAFSQMKPTAIFINTARGAIHNEIDLYRALETKRLWGAGLDVTNPEPMQAGNPLLFMPNTAILPHIGSATLETRMDMLNCCLENLIAGVTARPVPYLVNTDLQQK